MKIETDLEKIREAVRRKMRTRTGNFALSYKGYDIEVEELDSIVQRLFDLVSTEIDCAACGNCCREVSPTLELVDIERLSHGLGRLTPIGLFGNFSPASRKRSLLLIIAVFHNQHLCTGCA